MAEPEAEGGPRKRVGPPRDDPFGARLFAVSEGLAVLGGISLLIITVFTVLSVVGRTGFDLPILGDQEVVELGCAIAIFAFMPYCQMRAANVIVDFFTVPLNQATRDFLDALMNVAFSVCIALITWRLAVGAIGVFNSGDASMFLRIPLWWGYSFALLGSVLWTLACFYSVLRSVRFMRLAMRASSGTGMSG